MYRIDPNGTQSPAARGLSFWEEGFAMATAKLLMIVGDFVEDY